MRTYTSVFGVLVLPQGLWALHQGLAVQPHTPPYQPAVTLLLPPHSNPPTHPPSETMFRALEQLYALGALNDKGELTTMGEGSTAGRYGCASTCDTCDVGARWSCGSWTTTWC